MKQQIKAYIKKAELDGKKISLPGEMTVNLELSAIDTGGGFHDLYLLPSCRFKRSLITKMNGVIRIPRIPDKEIYSTLFIRGFVTPNVLS